MTPADIALITGELGPIIKAYVAQVTAPLLAHNKALELRVLELETRPPVPDPALETARSVIKDFYNREPPPSNSAFNALEHRVDALETRPIPERGERGPQGEKGESGLSVIGPMGERGPQGDKGDTGLSIVGPMGERGMPGERGEKGDIGISGKDGAAGLNGKDADPVDVDAVVMRVKSLIPIPRDGKDGVGVMDAVLDREGCLVLTFSDGRTKDIGFIVGRDGLDGRDAIGKDGAAGRDGRDVDMEHVKALVLSELSTWVRPKDGGPGPKGDQGESGGPGPMGVQGEKGIDGKDGLGFDEADLVFEETKGYVLRLTSGERTKDYHVPVVHDAGVWAAGWDYPQSAGVTWDGHFWIAQRATSEQPGEGCKDWRLAVRRGKQGKEGKPGKDFTPRTTNTPPLYG